MRLDQRSDREVMRDAAQAGRIAERILGLGSARAGRASSAATCVRAPAGPPMRPGRSAQAVPRIQR